MSSLYLENLAKLSGKTLTRFKKETAKSVEIVKC